MSDVRLYSDEHVARAVVTGLRQRGMDVLTVPEAAMLGARDEQHLDFARIEGRVILTQDIDFLALAATGRPHSGLIYAPQHTRIGNIIRAVIVIHQVLTAEEMVGKIEFI